ncbi:flagellar filament capping protein FliD [Clostridium butyricum]|uniref:flagellar filament capping protein FliD n=1 Tax=Clostridium butyricum TaxID=1492 RepID=UPI0005C1B819|nr:flagellar filament capping protein FliD [Clostridium butyricum]KIU09083.1 flagellar cap protein FliD [Clostridium butyricum]MBA8965409.1 flagellar hook-associated protein 2 [Clostridium butyricum]MBA8970034.1 flagellar hook-associated protein 2 [Clostridium butyricum]MBC2427669.1 flagellar filament capping protein FliD [Clostridium butyricum]NOW38940.1 flagellar hook-associated protein 2 [Clostridium butyricum]
MTNRITGTNSGIDVDTVVKQSLSTQQNKIDKAYQQQKVYEYQQAQLKEIVQQAQDFYDKYLDLLSGDSLLKDSAYESVKFTSTDINGNKSTAVTAKGYAGADVTNYEVTVTQLATKASTKVISDDLIDSDGNLKNKQISIEMDGKTVSVDIILDSSGKDVDMTATAKALNTALKSEGINITAKYSEFSQGIMIESGEMGENVSFKISTSTDAVIGQNAKGSIKKGNEIYTIDKPSNTFSVDNIQFTLNAITADPVKSSNHLTALESGANDTITTVEKDSIKTIVKNGSKTTTKIYDEISVSKTDNGNLIVNGNLTETDKDVTVEKNTADDGKETVKITKTLSDGTVVETISVTEGGTTTTTTTATNDAFNHLDVNDKSAKTTIISNDGKTTTVKENGITTTTHTQKDGSIIKTTQEEGGIPVTEISSGAITLSGETDISNLKDTIVSFISDYNKLMESINDKLWETRDKDYMPLTEEQKKEMSESEIESWEKKASTGLLRNDSDLRRIQSAMKSTMSSMMSSTGLTLESIGIEPVDNYTTKNGTFKIDEDKLSKALQNNAEEVKDLFTRSVTKDENGNVIDKGGVLTQLQSVLNSEFKSSSSSLSKRIGFDGTSTASSNTLSKNITKQKKLIEQLQEKYTTKETALYKKYSNLEVMLEKLNAQTNSLYSMLGISS